MTMIIIQIKTNELLCYLGWNGQSPGTHRAVSDADWPDVTGGWRRWQGWCKQLRGHEQRAQKPDHWRPQNQESARRVGIFVVNSSENKWEKTSKFNSYINGTRIELLWVFLVCVSETRLSVVCEKRIDL